jgi:hypothetical protein
VGDINPECGAGEIKGYSSPNLFHFLNYILNKNRSEAYGSLFCTTHLVGIDMLNSIYVWNKYSIFLSER